MPSVGVRKQPNMGRFASDPMYPYAAAFCEAQQNILMQESIDYSTEPSKALSFRGAMDQLKSFFIENSMLDQQYATEEEIQEHVNDMGEIFINDTQAIRENATTSLANYNPLIGLSLPMHKYLMLNCVFAQAVPRFVAKAPAWTETMETRYMVTPEGKRIDIANQQNEIFNAWKSANRPVEVPIILPEQATVDILEKYFNVNRISHHLSVETRICAIAVETYAKTGDPTVKIEGQTLTEEEAQEDGKAIKWLPWKAEFAPSYGEANRAVISPVNIEILDGEGDGETKKVFTDTIFATQQDDMFTITCAGGIKAVKILARYDASTRALKTNRVEWDERTTYVQIPEADGITVPVTPEEVKDIGALYGINQVTKYMSIIKDILENVKDDDIKMNLDDSLARLDDQHKLVKAIDFAPRQGYYGDHLQWLQSTFMNTLDQFITGLITVLRDPNMEISIIGRPGIIRQITPIEYTYTSPSAVGPIEMNFSKTVVTSDKRVYKFISSDKLFGNDNLIVLLNPKNTNRIVYRVYDYQMYISNEIRDAENPTLPALTAFQRYKFFEFQPVQGRLFVANPTGLREHLPNVDPIGSNYANNDLGSVYVHYDKATGRNIPTDNKIE